MIRVLTILFTCLAWTAQAATLEGRVVGVSDGDTITVLEVTKE